jgi:hypothetical protein
MNYLGLVKRFIILVALSLILFSCGGGSDSKDPLEEERIEWYLHGHPS